MCTHPYLVTRNTGESSGVLPLHRGAAHVLQHTDFPFFRLVPAPRPCSVGWRDARSCRGGTAPRSMEGAPPAGVSATRESSGLFHGMMGTLLLTAVQRAP